MKVELEVYREAGRWFVDDDNGFSKEDNELVSAIPFMIESMVGKVDRAKVVASSEPFNGAVRLRLENPDSMGGVEYSLEAPGGKVVGWLCTVFWHYFEIAPQELYVRVEGVTKKR